MVPDLEICLAHDILDLVDPRHEFSVFECGYGVVRCGGDHGMRAGDVGRSVGEPGDMNSIRDAVHTYKSFAEQKCGGRLLAHVTAS